MTLLSAFINVTSSNEIARWRIWLRHCPTSRKVAGSIPDYVIRIFHWHDPSDRNMALRLTQPLTEMSTRNISWEVKAAGTQGWQPYHLHVPIVLKSGSLAFLEPSGPVQACNGIALPLPLPLPLTKQPNTMAGEVTTAICIRQLAQSRAQDG